MPEQIKVEIFGIKDQASASGCGCSGGCGPMRTMGEIYKEFLYFLSKIGYNYVSCCFEI